MDTPYLTKTLILTTVLVALLLTLPLLTLNGPTLAQSDDTPAPTYTFYPTYTLYPTYTPYPSPTPSPTFDRRVELPPPLNTATLAYIGTEWAHGSPYTHGSGQFRVDDLPGWDRSQRGSLGNAGVVFNNRWLGSFVEVSVADWDRGTNLKALRDWLDPGHIKSLWNIYDSFRQTRLRDNETQLALDYELVYREAPFLGRLIFVPRENHLIRVTIVVPANAADLLPFLQKLIVPGVSIPAEDYTPTPTLSLTPESNRDEV
jgi:hypothetical protein